MRIAIIGLWHLGLVTAACLAKIKQDVIAYDSNEILIQNLQQGISPIQEPGLDELLKHGVQDKRLTYHTDPKILSTCEVIWVNIDTPVDEDDQANVNFVIEEFNKIAKFISANTLIIFSSQLPVGTTRKIQHTFTEQYSTHNVRFAYIPENLRLGKAIKVLMEADRFVVGLDNQDDQQKITHLLGAFTQQFIWMSIESAEMTKHALNAFLALSVTFINEIATLCENVGANAREVEAGLKSEERIGAKAYLKPGSAIAGGTLLRDIQYLNHIGEQQQHPIPLLSAINKSNAYHKQWTHRKITEQLKTLQNKTVAVLGLTYKVNTNTLRRSSAIETCHWLSQQGANVHAYDPAIEVLPTEYVFINLKSNLLDALYTADAIIVATEWPDFRKLEAEALLKSSRQPLVIDPNGFLANNLGQDDRIQYYSVGNAYAITQ